MSSSLNVLSITGLKEIGWSEKYGKTLCVNAFTKSALYCEGKIQSKNQSVSTRDVAVNQLVNGLIFGEPDTKFSHAQMKANIWCHISVWLDVSPAGCESGGGC